MKEEQIRCPKCHDADYIVVSDENKRNVCLDCGYEHRIRGLN